MQREFIQNPVRLVGLDRRGYDLNGNYLFNNIDNSKELIIGKTMMGN